ncbi:DNA polymerase III subunit epsilon [Chlamydiales bacterium SCGC AB-751-O23]|nr:DNA polymerase III subunit epsilon [Chlamydiales bacterium SCGC AB-751-O23]
MTKSTKDEFVCIDCETTGLDTAKDEVIEVAVVRFTMDTTLDSFETLLDPGVIIPEESIKIHHITQDMVQDKPKVRKILPQISKFFEGNPYIVGHGVSFDLDILNRYSAGHPSLVYAKNRVIDTLRLARLYGQSPTNSLESLREHFNIQALGAHRAMSDVLVNIQVFKQLSLNYQSAKDVLKVLEKPIFYLICRWGNIKEGP